MYCEQHLKRNLQAQTSFTATKPLIKVYHDIVNAVTEKESNDHMALLLQLCPEMHAYLCNVDPTGSWVLWKAIKRGNCLMGVHSDNMVESVFAQLLGPRKKCTVFYFLQAAFAAINDKYIKHHKKSQEWGKLYTVAVDKHFAALEKKIQPRHERVIVFDPPPGQECGSVEENFGAVQNVDLASRHCTCEKWTQLRKMCIHAFLLAEKVRRPFDPYQSSFIDDFWTTRNYRSLYLDCDRK